MRVHFLVNTHRPDALSAGIEAVLWLKERGFELAGDAETATALGIETVGLRMISEADLVVCFGGDGTLIRAADLCSEKGTPILGVYYGRFGFVTQCLGSDVTACFEEFFAGRAQTETRMMVQTDLERGGKTIATLHALNEMALQRSATDRMLVFNIEVDGQNLTSYPADGVIVCTPTGSTAYNLSAGGPILEPRVQALVLSAIAPHTLSSRPLVLHPEAQVKLRLQTHGDAVLSADGQTRLHLLSGDVVKVTRSPRVTRLVVLEANDFLKKLGRKLLWSQSLAGFQDDA